MKEWILLIEVSCGKNLKTFLKDISWFFYTGSINNIKHIGEEMNYTDWSFISGNLLTFFVLLRADLGYKSLFIRLIMSLCIFDTLCIAFNISIFSGPLLDETYRLQVKSSQCWNDLKLIFYSLLDLPMPCSNNFTICPNFADRLCFHHFGCCNRAFLIYLQVIL